MKKLLLNLVLVLTASFSLAMPALAATANQQLFDPCTINGKTSNSPICRDRNRKTNPVVDTIRTAANLVALATGIAAVVLIVLGGLTMITSAGNSENVATARKRVTYAVVGLVVVAVAWTLVAFVTDQLLK